MVEKPNFKSLSSGLKELIAEEESQKRYDYLFDLLLCKKHDELKDFFYEKAHLIDTIALKALKIYFHKNILKDEIKDLSINKLKPFMQAALEKEFANIDKKLLNKELSPAQTVIKAEKPSYKLKLLEGEKIFDAKNFQEALNAVYQEISELQNQAAEISKIDKETCFKANCCDCCVYTPPLVTKLEFEYIKAHYDLEAYKKNAEKNQKLHQAEFGTKLELIDLNKERKEAMNPNNFSHRCPFLAEDNSCSIHQHRPFACRFYGLSTLDGETVQACNYYLEQFDPDERTVFDSRKATALLGKANKELCEGEQLAGTLTAWLDLGILQSIQ